MPNFSVETLFLGGLDPLTFRFGFKKYLICLQTPLIIVFYTYITVVEAEIHQIWEIGFYIQFVGIMKV